MAAENAGAYTASIHPIKSFASTADSIDSASTIYGVTYPKKQRKQEFIDCFIAGMEGTIIEVDDEKKSFTTLLPVWHPLSVTLAKYATDIHGSIGIKAED